MIYSMTGYGRANGTYNDKAISVELRAVNSKLADIKMRLPGDYKEKEIELRKLVTDHAERGKIDMVVDVVNADGAAGVALNEGLFRGYHDILSRLTGELDISGDMIQAILRIPNVVGAPNGSIEDEEWQVTVGVLEKALNELKKFREEEGRSLQKDLQERVESIQDLLEQVGPYEQERFERMRNRIQQNMEEVIGKEKIDQNRFEQEVLFYLEKMDISEEKVRLSQHCKFFISKMVEADQPVGRSLNFISQEMGREINTLGAKAYDAGLQRVVVQMKEQLEKIKEQLANVL